MDPMCAAYCPHDSPVASTSALTMAMGISVSPHVPRSGSMSVAAAARLALSQTATQTPAPVEHTSYIPYSSSYCQTVHEEDEDLEDNYASYVPLQTRHPVSSDRDAPASPTTATTATRRSTSPTHSAASSSYSRTSGTGSSILSQYPIHRTPPELSPGVLADGSKTINYPPVQQVLSEPHLGRKHPLLADRVVEALVILAVMRQPSHPLHLKYWDGGSAEEKMALARRYDDTMRVWQGLEASPPTIRAPWLYHGLFEAVYQMRRMQAQDAISEEFKPVGTERERTTTRTSRKRKTEEAGGEGATQKRTRVPASSGAGNGGGNGGDGEGRTTRSSRATDNGKDKATGVEDGPEDGSPPPPPRRSARNRASPDAADLPKRPAHARSPSTASTLAPSASGSSTSSLTAVSERGLSEVAEGDERDGAVSFGDDLQDDVEMEDADAVDAEAVEDEQADEAPKRSARARRPSKKADPMGEDNMPSPVKRRSSGSGSSSGAGSRAKNSAAATATKTSARSSRTKVQRVTRIPA